MAKLIALYNKPPNATAFDAYYLSKHVPIAKKVPGLRRYEINAGPVGSPAGEAPYHMVATMTFDSLDAIQRALTSPEGQAAAADLAKFAQAGVELLIFDSKDV